MLFSLERLYQVHIRLGQSASRVIRVPRESRDLRGHLRQGRISSKRARRLPALRLLARGAAALVISARRATVQRAMAGTGSISASARFRRTLPMCSRLTGHIGSLCQKMDRSTCSRSAVRATLTEQPAQTILWRFRPRGHLSLPKGALSTDHLIWSSLGGLTTAPAIGR